MQHQPEETGTFTVGGGILSRQSVESISERLSNLDNLYFPRALQSSATTPPDRKSLLLHLLSRDVAVFLERYGLQLTSEELKEFDVLKSDYEINWHLSHLRSLLNPTEEELKSRTVKIKNRRRAYLGKLVSGGQYFSEDAMREREPYLHHEYLGKFQDPSGRSMARPGERWSETLMRRCEEAMLVDKIRGEQQLRGVAQRDWVGGNDRDQQEEEQVEEEEEEEEEEEDIEEKEEQGGGNEKMALVEEDREEDMVNHAGSGTSLFGEISGAPSQNNSHTAATTTTAVIEQQEMEGEVEMEMEMETLLSEEEMQERLDQFTYIMQQKFLSGEDHLHLDYSKIDEDESLDDHWMKEANLDAEEKYFDDV